MKISILIPVFNEKKTILKILEKVNIEKKNFDLQIVVSDDGSNDGTVEILKKNEHLFDIFVNKTSNDGKGSAIIEGLKKCSGEYTLIQDADLEYDPEDYPKLFKPIIKHEADVVYGSRFLGSNEDAHRVLYFWHRVANGILTTVANILIDMNLTDMETGYKAFKKSAIDNITIEENRFGFEPEITIKLAKKKLRFFEVGISYNGRTYEEGKKIGLKDGFRAVYCLFKYKFF